MWSSAVGFKGAGASEGHGGHIWQVWEDVKEAGAPGRAGITWTGGGGWGGGWRHVAHGCFCGWHRLPGVPEEGGGTLPGTGDPRCW